MTHDPDPFLVVGLGASAGGLGALEAFFSGLPKTDGAAFVVVIHLDPERESELAEILGRTVPMPFTQVTERTEIRPGHVYVIPPDRNLLMADGHLELAPLEDARHERRPIDHFFRTLADAYAEHAVGVVLSGTGQNGTVGVRRIKETGGLVLAQTPADAEFDEMPRSAIVSGVVDGQAPAGQLAADVIAYAERLKRVRVAADGELPDDEVEAVRHVLALLRTRTGHDFAHYKRATVLRRIERRLHVVGADSISAYHRHLRANPGETEALLDDLLIHVTNFFRDPEAFEALAREVVPGLFQEARREIRVWVAGCATGEEAYSVAIVLAEHAASLAAPPAVQVFATDLSEAAIETARVGVYPESIEADVSPERLQRFFRKTPAGYRVAESLRETVLFAPHSLFKDPPFARLDLVTCRNLLIYLQRGLQRRVLELFHYALRPGGWLMLGASETADAAQDLFAPVHRAARLYGRQDAESSLPHVPATSRLPRPEPADEPPGDARGGPPRPDREASAAALHERLRAATAPPSVLVDAAYNVVHLSDGVAPYLQLSAGDPTRSVIRLVVPPLRAAVQTALFQSRRQRAPVETGPVRLAEGEAVRLRVTAVEASELVQVAFLSAPPPPPVPLSEDEATRALAEELQETQEQLQLTIEEFETSREELRAQNEELQSINEELRSTAEELETSKEETQSVAEELQTVNDELKVKVEELAQAKGDLENLIASTEIATLFLDRDLTIQWFTPHVRQHFHVRSSDVGRPLADLAQKFGGARLAEDTEAVVEGLDVPQREVRGENGRWFLVQVRPYRAGDGRIGGVVVTFVDITERTRAVGALRASEERYRLLVEGATEYAMLALDPDGTITGWNTGAERIFGYAEAEAVGQSGRLIFTEEERAAGVPEHELAEAAETGQASDDRWQRRRDGSHFWASGVTTALRTGGGEVRAFVKVLRDNTQRKQAEAALEASVARAGFRATLADVLRQPSGPDEIQTRTARLLAEYLGAHRVVYAETGEDGQWGAVSVDHAVGVESMIGHPSLVSAGTALAEALGAGQTFVVADATRDPRLGAEARQATAAREVAAYVAAPFVRDGQTRALVAVHARAPRDWTDAEVTLVEETAARAWTAIEAARAEAALRQTEARFRQAVDAARLGVWSYELPDGPIEFDARARQFFGLGDGPLTGREVCARIHPDDRAAFEAAREAALDPDGPGVFAETHRVVWPDGEVRWVRGQAEVAFESAGGRRRPARAAGVVFDVTEQRAAQAALRNSEERFRETAETVPDVLFTASPDGLVTYISAQFEAFTGVPAEEVIGTTLWLHLVHPDDRDRVAAAWARSCATAERFEERYRLEIVTDGYLWVLTRARPVLDAEGETARWSGTVTDIDALVQAEQAVQSVNETLEARVAERTAQVRDLAAQLTVAEQAERQRLAHVLHDDLQQQLYGLSLLLLVARTGPPEQVEASLLRAEAILGEAVALTRSLSSDLNPVVLESERVEDLAGWLAERERARGRLAVTVAGAGRVADASVRALLYQALRELLFNVVKHAGTDHVQITIAERSGAVAVVVEDQGIGFDGSAEDHAEGFGMSSIRNRLSAVGGQIEVESAPGRGTRVTVVVPATAVPAAAVPVA